MEMLQELEASLEGVAAVPRLFYYAIWVKLMEFVGGMFILSCASPGVWFARDEKSLPSRGRSRHQDYHPKVMSSKGASGSHLFVCYPSFNRIEHLRTATVGDLYTGWELSQGLRISRAYANHGRKWGRRNQPGCSWRLQPADQLFGSVAIVRHRRLATAG